MVVVEFLKRQLNAQQTTQQLMNPARNQRGLTLFEILIVIGIIGGLLAFILPQIQKNSNKSKVGETRIKMSNVVQQLTLYQNDCQKFPSSLDGLVKADDCQNWTGPYLKDVPKDAWGTPFKYESTESGYNLFSLGADRKEGGDGFNKDLSAEDLQ